MKYIVNLVHVMNLLGNWKFVLFEAFRWISYAILTDCSLPCLLCYSIQTQILWRHPLNEITFSHAKRYNGCNHRHDIWCIAFYDQKFLAHCTISPMPCEQITIHWFVTEFRNVMNKYWKIISVCWAPQKVGLGFWYRLRVFASKNIWMHAYFAYIHLCYFTLSSSLH